MLTSANPQPAGERWPGERRGSVCSRVIGSLICLCVRLASAVTAALSARCVLASVCSDADRRSGERPVPAG